jgi:xyloglucan 6-xylosyltransferase
MDSDALFTDMAFEPPWDRYKPYNLDDWHDLIYKEKNWVGLNTGSFFIRNCQWSLDIEKIDRAFNFVDDQILQMYGFVHK